MFRREKKITVRLEGDWVHIDAINFMGRWTRSANQRWLLAHGNIHNPSSGGWSSDESSGAVLLFDGGKQAARLDGLTRPETVAVCDAGVFAVYEWGPSSEFLGPLCQLRVFSASGQQLLKQKPGAVVERLALSASGQLLAFHTLSAPDESKQPEDGSSIFLVDLSGPAFVWQAPVPFRWPRSMRFSEDEAMLHLDGENEIFNYDMQGTLLNPEAVDRARLKQARAHKYGYSLWELANGRMREIRNGSRDVDEQPKVLGLLREALGKEISPNTKASIYRLIGEIAEESGDPATAIREYRTALDLNPKVGVKRRLKRLEERH